MSEMDLQALREACLQTFGREFSDEELDYYGSRLQRQLQALERLRAWEAKLGLTEPATVSTLFGAPRP